MLAASFLFLAGLAADPTALEYALPARITGERTIEVGPGSVTIAGEKRAVTNAASFTIPGARVSVRDEAVGPVPIYNENTGGWVRGARPKGIVTEECTATGALYAETLKLKPGPGNVPAFVLDKDYRMEPFWGTFGRVEGGAIKPDQPIYIDYDYAPNRLDSIFLDKTGTLRLALGQPGVGSQYPVKPEAGAVAVLNVFQQGITGHLTNENLYPIEFRAQEQPVPGEAPAERLLPKTLAKLRAGAPVTYVAWGDSVTAGGGVGSDKSRWYQEIFTRRLQERFPQSKITLRTAAWPGGNSNGYMSAPKGGTYDYQRDVLDPKPDFVSIEFVNDAGLDEEGVKEHYGKILADLRGIGAEVILITPHLVRPDWLKSETMKFDEDPRPYVRGLRLFASENQVALADASKGWCRLWRQGIPYMTIEANSINHPDLRGHTLFADSLMSVFPEK